MKKYQQLQSIRELKEGEIIRSTLTKTVYRVHENYGDRATAVRIADVTNPDEWEVYRDAEDEFTLEFLNEDKTYRISLTGSIKRCDSDLLFDCAVKKPGEPIPKREFGYLSLNPTKFLTRLDLIEQLSKPRSQALVTPKWDEHELMRVKGRSIEMDEGEMAEGMTVKVYLRLEAIK